MITSQLCKISRNAEDTVLNLGYLAIKLPNCKPVDEKLARVESFDVKIVSGKKAVLESPQTPQTVKFFCFKILFCI